jgi:hypothetical protein
MKTKPVNTRYFAIFTRCLPARFAPFSSVCDSMYCAAEEHAWLRSVVLLYGVIQTMADEFRNRFLITAPSNSDTQKMALRLESEGNLQSRH